MSIQSEIERINNAKEGIAAAIASKGVTVGEGTSIDDFPALVRSIPQEGGGSGGENVSDVLWVTATLNPDTFRISNVSHSYDEILQALAESKIVKLKAKAYGYDVEYAICEVSYCSIMSGYVLFSIFVRYNIEGMGTVLIFANVSINSDNSVSCNPYAIELIGIGG